MWAGLRKLYFVLFQKGLEKYCTLLWLWAWFRKIFRFKCKQSWDKIFPVQGWETTLFYLNKTQKSIVLCCLCEQSSGIYFALDVRRVQINYLPCVWAGFEKTTVLCSIWARPRKVLYCVLCLWAGSRNILCCKCEQGPEKEHLLHAKDQQDDAQERGQVQ